MNHPISTVSQAIKFRNRRRLKFQHNPWLRMGLSLGILFCMLGVIISLAAVWVYSDLTRDLPSIELLPALLEPPDGLILHPTRLYDRTHEHILYTLENPAAAGKRYLHIGKEGQDGQDQFSKYLVEATIAALDPDIWKHPGFTLAGLRNGSPSTLAERLVTDLLLIDEPASVERNIRERLLAGQITAQFGREKILEWFLNSAPYGGLIFGADAAAHAYFDKSATDLSLAEATMLTAILRIQAAGPYSSMPMFKQQQEEIIQVMMENRFIDANDAQRALVEKLQIQAQIPAESFAPAFVALVMQQLSKQINLERIQRGGFDIVTTLDYELHVQATCATEIQVLRIQSTPESSQEIDLEACDAGLLLPNMQLSTEAPLEDIHANVVILDPHTGQILSLVGSDEVRSDPAYASQHPGGTILSPFLYLTAFARGLNPATLLWDIPHDGALEDEGVDQVEPSQDIISAFHGPVRARTALVNDYLVATADVLQQVGVENVLLTGKRFGITDSSSIASPGTTIEDLYSTQITLLDAISAYGVLANEGIMSGQPGLGDGNEDDTAILKPTSILQVIGRDGTIWLDRSVAQSRSIISPQLAFLATHILSDEYARRPNLGHPNSLEIGRPAAAKVGVTAGGDGAWAVGYVPQLAVGVWLGHMREKEADISWEMPAGLWHAITKYASRRYPDLEFDPPAGIKLVQVCDPSGLLVSPLCPTIVQEAFLEGNEPTQVDDLYQKFSVNRETGLLATIFTPLDMVEEKVYLAVPPQAVIWARKSGFPIPPDTYDVIYSTVPGSPDVRISHPPPFAHVGGLVNITGTAAGPDFSYYRLQVGKGLNPQEWILIGEEQYNPVMDESLGTWDTTELEGLYVVQLLVVSKDQRIERDILQLTIDNTQPQVQIITPGAGEIIPYQAGEPLLVEVSASDNLIIGRIEFFVDGELQMTLYQPPFIILWPQKVDRHTLLVRAYDMAGNSGEAEISFSVQK